MAIFGHTEPSSGIYDDSYVNYTDINTHARTDYRNTRNQDTIHEIHISEENRKHNERTGMPRHRAHRFT